jgi:phosphoribosylformimino-5-aminoimidazole carboxamide ribotide isomerase
MTIYPAIDLRAGRQVGLVDGDLDRQRRYGDAAAFARARAAEGFSALHVVDLDGAAAGRPTQLATVRDIRRAAPGLLLQVGGGVRSVEDARALRRAGADRVVVGTAVVRPLVTAPLTAARLIGELLAALGPDGLAVAVDGTGATIAVEAWRSHLPADATELGRRLADVGVRWVVHTDTGRDGRLAGVRPRAAAGLAGTGLRVIAGGGASADADLARLAAAGVAGAVVGRAFHAGAWRPAPVWPRTGMTA